MNKFLYFWINLYGFIEIATSCSQYFSYQNDGQQNYGYIQVPSPPLGQELKLEIYMSFPGRLKNPNYVGSLNIVGTSAEVAQDVANGRLLRYTVTFPEPESASPSVTSIVYNGQTLCNGQPATGYSTRIHLYHILTTTGSSASAVLENKINIQQTPQYYDTSNQQTYYQQRPVQSQNSPQQNYYQQKPVQATQQQNYYQQQQQPVQSTQQQQQNYYQQQTQNAVQPDQNPLSQQIETPFEQYEIVQPVTRPPVTRPPARPPATRPPPPAPEPQYEQPSAPASTSNSQQDEDVCGVPVRNSVTLAVGGQEVFRGEFPWIAAITKSNNAYHCSGTLVSKQTVLTAAHCVVDPDGEPYSTKEILVHLGRASLQSFPASGYQIGQPKKIIPHDDYTPDETAKSFDIALIVLRRKIAYNEYIRPICLWQGTDNFSNIVNQKGIVVGWGRDETGRTTQVANKVTVTIVSRDTCYKSNSQYESLLVEGTFCAGNRDGTGPCNGDSGGGLVIRTNGRYYVRGIVSSSLFDPSTNSCDLKNYVIFTDVVKNRDWLSVNIKF